MPGPLPKFNEHAFFCSLISTPSGAMRRLPARSAALLIPSSSGGNAGRRLTRSVMRRELEPEADSLRSSERRSSPWLALRPVKLASPGCAGREKNSPRWPSSSRSLGASRRERFAPGCGKTKSNPGAITPGNIPKTRSLSKKPRRCWIFISTRRSWPRKERSWSVLMRRPRSKPGSASV